MNILFTCGGTAGHINPAVALARMFRERDGANILFVGADGGMETRLVPKEGFALKTVTITNFRRSARPKPFWMSSSRIWWWVPAATPPTLW